MILAQDKEQVFTIDDGEIIFNEDGQEIFEELLDGRLSKDIFLNEVKERKYYFYKYFFTIFLTSNSPKEFIK